MSDFEPGLSEALHRARKVHGPVPVVDRPCTVCILIEHTKPGAREALVAAAAGTISVRTLHLALRDLGVGISRDSLNNHRNEAHSV